MFASVGADGSVRMFDLRLVIFIMVLGVMYLCENFYVTLLSVYIHTGHAEKYA